MIEWTVTVEAPTGETMTRSTWDRAEAFYILGEFARLLVGKRYLKATLHNI